MRINANTDEIPRWKFKGGLPSSKIPASEGGTDALRHLKTGIMNKNTNLTMKDEPGENPNSCPWCESLHDRRNAQKGKENTNPKFVV